MIETRQEIKRPRMLKTGFEAADEGYSMGCYLDEDRYNQEKDTLSKIRRGLSGELISSLKFSNKKDANEWDLLSNRIIQIDGASKGIEEAFNRTVIKGTIIGNDVTHLIAVARDLMTLETMEEQKKIAKRNDFYHKGFEPYEQPTIFDLCGNLNMKIGKLSILDIVRGKNVSPTEYYDCQINAFITRLCLVHDEVLSKNENTFSNLYPNKSRQFIQESTGQILGMADLSPEIADQIFSHIISKDDVTTDVINRIKDIVKQTDLLEQNVFNAILNPRSNFFPTLKILFEKYFNNDNPTIKVLALQKLGLRLKDRKIKGYRKAKKLATENGENGQFYANLADAIRKISIEESPQELNILTHDDVVMFLNGDSTNSNASFEELRKLRMEIVPKLSKDEYVISPSEIEWHGLIEPTSVSFKFNRDFQSKFKVTFHYENERGEKTELDFDIDTKSNKESIDWDFLESPDASEMQGMKNAAMLSVRSALFAVLEQIESEHKERQKAKSTVIVPQSEEAPTKKHEQRDVYVPREKEEKLKQQKLSFVERISQEEISPTRSGIKSYIDNEDPNFEKLIEDLPDLIQNQIRKGVLELKSGIVNKFKALSPMKYNGKPVYGLTVGDYRVLAIEANLNDNGLNGSGEKLRRFLPIQVQNRKDIFKKKNKRNYL